MAWKFKYKKKKIKLPFKGNKNILKEDLPTSLGNSYTQGIESYTMPYEIPHDLRTRVIIDSMKKENKDFEDKMKNLIIFEP